jgi:hypothetical protein
VDFKTRKFLVEWIRSFPKTDLGGCSFSACIKPAIRSSLDDFLTALARKLAIHLLRLAGHIGAPIASNGKSRKLIVEP